MVFAALLSSLCLLSFVNIHTKNTSNGKRKVFPKLEIAILANSLLACHRRTGGYMGFSIAKDTSLVSGRERKTKSQARWAHKRPATAMTRNTKPPPDDIGILGPKTEVNHQLFNARLVKTAVRVG